MNKQHLPTISAYTLTPDRNTTDQHDLECELCGNKWSAAPTSVAYRARKRGHNVGCPICNRNAYKQTANDHRKTKKPSLDDDLAKLGFKLLEPYTNGHAKHLLRCVSCGHESNNTTVISRKQMSKKAGQPGCIHCTDHQRQRFIDAKVETYDDLIKFEDNSK